jgi:NAD(P)-dependent dehydrogenase (short-subunit alcohol dehydrogenase family)
MIALVSTYLTILQDGKEYNAWIAYGRSKTANILFTYALAEKYGEKLTSLVADPGSESFL